MIWRAALIFLCGADLQICGGISRSRLFGDIDHCGLRRSGDRLADLEICPTSDWQLSKLQGAAGGFSTVLLAALSPQQPAPVTEKEPAEALDFLCPMDKDVRSAQPGKCPRCGMKLVPGIPDLTEYPVEIKLSPKVARAGKPVDMTFRVEAPKDGSTVTKFEVIHEKLFHLFLISEDLSFFAHEHPEYNANGLFRYRATLPKAGAYRVATDFYPVGGSPQMNVGTLYAAGPMEPKRKLQPDRGPQASQNLRVELDTEPPQPLAGFKTLLFFKLTGANGAEVKLQPYLGAWGHMLAASEDLIDVVHTHPFIADGGPKVQFNMLFPREGIYRVWVQFQNQGVVNTLAYNITVNALR